MTAAKKYLNTAINVQTSHDQRPQFTVIEGGAKKTDQHRLTEKNARREQLRFLSGLAVALFLLAIVWFRGDITAKARLDAAFEDAPTATVTVMPGDSLWQIAEEHPFEGVTTAQLVHHIKDTNQLNDSFLHVGMQLSVPVNTAEC